MLEARRAGGAFPGTLLVNGMSESYEDLTREQLLEELRRLESRQRQQQIQSHELRVCKEELGAQNEQLKKAEQLLKESRDRYADLYDYAPFAYVTLDRNGLIRDINLMGAQLLGGQRDRLVHQPMKSCLSPPDAGKFADHLRRCAQGEEQVVSELRLNRADDRLVPVQLTTVSTRESECEMKAFGALFPTAITDLTEWKKAEDEIRASAERLRLAQSAGRVGTWEYCVDAQELRWSEEKSRMFGLTTHVPLVSYEQWLSFVHPDDRERISRGQCAGESEYVEFEYRIVRPDGQVRWMVTRGRVLREELGTKVVGVTLDITESRKIQQQLQEVNEALIQRTREAEDRTRQLRALAGELTRAESRERRRLASLLHDHLQQLLIALRMKVGLSKNQPRAERTDTLLAQSVSLLDEAIQASRSLSVELSPPMLYETGLAAALEWLAGQMQEKHGLTVHLEAHAEPEDDDVRVFLYQCVRELLFNVVKHANSHEALVSMHRLDDRQLRVSVRDFGKGFDLSALPQSPESFGLISIRERIGWLGGRLEIKTAPGEGTEATLVVPARDLSADVRERRSGTPPAPWEDRENGHLPIRVLVVDNHPIVRQGLSSLLEQEPGFRVVAQAADGQDAVDYARSLPVDVVVMDFSMPRMNGAEATRRILEVKPQVVVVGMSVYEDQSIADSMRKAGAAAFFRKDDPSEELIGSLRSLVVKPHERDAAGVSS